MRRDVAIDRLNTAVADFVAALPTIAWVRSDGDEWGTHEVLSHLVFWHETYVRIVSALKLGNRTPLTGVFRDFNTLAVERFRRTDDRLLGRRLAKAEQVLATELTALPPSARIRIKTGAMARGPAEFADRIAAHIRGHLVDLSRKSRRSAVGRSLPAPGSRSILRA